MPKENENNYTYGDAVATAYGVPRELVLSSEAHILASLAGPKPQFWAFDMPMPFRSGGFVIAGSQARIGSLVDQLLTPIHDYQRRRLHSREPLAALSTSTNITKGLADNAAGNVRLDERLEIAQTRERFLYNLQTRNLHRYAGTHPMLLVEGVDPSEVLSRAVESKDASPIWFDRGCLLGQASAKSLSALQPCLQGHQAKPGKSAVSRHSKLGYLATLEIDDLSNLANDNSDSLRKLQAMSTFMLLPEDKTDEEMDTDLSGIENELKHELLLWELAVKEAILLRDEETALSATSIRTLAEEVHRYRLKSIREFGEAKGIVDSQILNDLLPKMLFGVALLSSQGASFNSCPAVTASQLHQFLYTKQLEAEQWIEEQANRSSLDRDKACLIRALERKGPCTWSQLRRSLNKQSREDNDAAINALISEGRLHLDDVGVFHLKAKEEAA